MMKEEDALDAPSTDGISIIDPDGDVLLIIPDKRDPPPDTDESPTPARFLVSSKHLTLASAFFKAQFSTNWRVGSELALNGSVKVHLSSTEHDSETMHILLHIIHGRQRQVPFEVTQDRLWKVALATDFFLCHEALQTWGLWCSRGLVREFPRDFTSSTWEWIFISYVFGWDSLFKHPTKIAQQKSCAAAYDGTSPVPKWILDEIYTKRNDYLQQCFDLAHERVAYLASYDKRCTFDCDAMKAGALLKYLGNFTVMRLQAARGYQPIISNSNCSPFLFCQASRQWLNPAHDNKTTSNSPQNRDIYRRPIQNPKDPSCAHTSLLGDELSQHINQIEKRLNGISDIPEWGSELR
jgi:hypothetical protein